MKDPSSAQDAVNTRSSPTNPLPGQDDVWTKCPLGAFQQWPHILQASAHAIACLASPVALLWGEDLVVLHNKHWPEDAGLIQGRPSHLPQDAVDSIRSAQEHGGTKQIDSDDLLQARTGQAPLASVAVLSPLLCEGARGVLIHLLPALPQLQSAQLDVSNSGARPQRNSLFRNPSSDSWQSIEKTPIDEHPFFRRFAEMLPSGLAILDHNAQAVFVNQHFYDLTTSRDGDRTFTSWPRSIHPSDYDRVMDAYRDAFSSKQQLRTEFRARGDTHPWRLLLLTPLADENLKHVSLKESGGFICSIVDISSEKSAELEERKAAKQARERKEQQERFIDMISHEIRNPLSAVLHCAEDITEAISAKEGGDIDIKLIREAVETIHLCVSHQKNIVDDVLSFSKLDASLLSLTPKPSQPERQLRNTLKMFQHEFRKQRLDFDFEVDNSYAETNVSWVMADLARVSQVLINLITNAIKFTHGAEAERQVHCSIGASSSRPASYPPNVVFFETDNLAHRMDGTNTPEWGTGDVLYVMVAVKVGKSPIRMTAQCETRSVSSHGISSLAQLTLTHFAQDTGIGISAESQERLFERFRQATPKTEEVYGGSGLGLNISRKICHLHGGEIGVSSREGEGSTFGFFFKVRRSDAPNDQAAAAEDEKEGDKKMRGKIRRLGSQKPGEMDSEEPFEWSSPSGTENPTDARPQPSDEARTLPVLPGPIPNSADPKAKSNTTGHGDGSGVRAEAGSANETLKPATSETHANPEDAEREEQTHVLLVEDNIINQRLLVRKLGSKGFRVSTANNGQEALEAIRKAPRPSSGDAGAFDVILMDQEMPVLDGNAATKAIRALVEKGELEPIPILGVTANVRGAQQDEMLAAGMGK